MAGIIGYMWVCVEEGFFEIFERRVIHVELPLQCAIRHAPTALEPGQGLVENLLEGHGRPSTALARVPRESNVCQRGVSNRLLTNSVFVPTKGHCSGTISQHLITPPETIVVDHTKQRSIADRGNHRKEPADLLCKAIQVYQSRVLS
jgi:hypothetical protein